MRTASCSATAPTSRYVDPSLKPCAPSSRRRGSSTTRAASCASTGHQAGLFSELESLAASVQTTRRWDEQVRSLLALVEASEARKADPAEGEDKPVTSADVHGKRNERGSARSSLNREYPVPTSLRATLRPYQVEGLPLAHLPLRAPHGRHPRRRHGPGQNCAGPRPARPRDRGAQHRGSRGAVRALPRGRANLRHLELGGGGRTIPTRGEDRHHHRNHRRQDPAGRTRGRAHLVLTSYTLLRVDEDAYVSYAAGLGSDEGPGGETPGWGALLLDEAQFVKNTGTRAWSIARAMPARTKIAMTGTPIENNLMELWALLAIVADGLFPRPRAFRDLYARPAESGEDSAHAAATTARLRQRIRPLMLRRTKELVAAELPAKNDVRVNLPLSPVTAASTTRTCSASVRRFWACWRIWTRTASRSSSR